MNVKIILASTSYIRKKMMQDAGFKEGKDFIAIAPLADEDSYKKGLSNLPYIKQALELAKIKAASISKEHKDKYIIGSDQICSLEPLDNKSLEKNEDNSTWGIISKSKNFAEAYASLSKLQGRVHRQNNAVCVYYNGESIFEFTDSAKLYMKPLTEREITEYINTDNATGTAGSYKYELNGHKLFEKIVGNHETIQGFNISELKTFFQNL